MDYFDADCLCLRTIDYKDNDKLLTLYAPEKGKISAVAKGCKSPKAKLKYAASPLCFGHYYFSVKGGRYVLTGCDCYDSFFDVISDMEKYCCAMVVVETLDKCQMEGQYEHDLYVSCLNALRRLKGQVDNAEAFAVEFLASAIELLGYKRQKMNLKDTYNFFDKELGVKLNSLQMLIKL
ncbi:MAG: DNA repair protein RecO [Christensenellales bacterium]